LKRLVLDASVALKWYLADEGDSAEALDLLNRYISGELEIMAPALLQYEVINGLMVARKRSRIHEEVILSAIEGFVKLGLRFVGLSGHHSRILYYCKSYSRSAYDASYLALAEAEQIPFITADERLYNAVKKDLDWVKWLGDH
jgi:predicted nucleic acid-binding protein